MLVYGTEIFISKSIEVTFDDNVVITSELLLLEHSAEYLLNTSADASPDSSEVSDSPEIIEDEEEVSDEEEEMRAYRGMILMPTIQEEEEEENESEKDAKKEEEKK